MESECVRYRRDYWQDQPTYLEIWSEKDAINGSIEEVLDEYGLPHTPIRGFNSTTKTHEAAERFLAKIRDGKSVVVFYLGDWDPSGECIENDVRDRVLSYRIDNETWKFDIFRLAIRKADIRRFRLPPLKVKAGDSRSQGFVRKHGDRAVELDALPPTELRRRLRDAVEEQLDHRAWAPLHDGRKSTARDQQAVRGHLQANAKRCRSLMSHAPDWKMKQTGVPTYGCERCLYISRHGRGSEKIIASNAEQKQEERPRASKQEHDDARTPIRA